VCGTPGGPGHPRKNQVGKIAMTQEDVRYMEMAVAQARRCVPEDENPHPFVGVVVVTADGKVTTAYRGELDPGQHAEFVALERKLGNQNVAGATVYTTLEPCTTRSHPKVPCADRLVDRRVRRVFIGMLDPNPDILGKGVLRLRQANIEVQFFHPDLMAQVEDLNRDFIRAQTSRKLEVPLSVTLPEKAATLDPDACDLLAQAYARRGDHRKAISWADRSLSHALKANDERRIVQSALLLAQQYRHLGIFNESLRYYALAEEHARRCNFTDFQTRLDLLRIAAGRIMVKRVIIEGNPRAALQEYKFLQSELKALEDCAKKADPATFEIAKLYRLHGERMVAEMLRQLGYYSRARRKFQGLFKRYKFSEVSPKAWSLLGEGEACRLLGVWGAARDCYTEVENFARQEGDDRLLARVLRSKAELYRTLGENADEVLAELRDLADKTGYLFGKIYYWLIRAAQSLQRGEVEEARERFEHARGLCVLEGEPLGFEAIHCTLGLAEVRRLAGDLDGARRLLCEASSEYLKRGVAWGYLRAELALRVLDPKRRPPGKTWTMRGDWAFQQLEARSRGSSTLPSVMENLL